MTGKLVSHEICGLIPAFFFLAKTVAAAIKIRAMKPIRDIEYFKRELAKNPALPRPNPDDDLIRSLDEFSREYRGAVRSYDAARIELKIATPEEINRKNSIFGASRPRLINFHVQPHEIRLRTH